MAVTYREVGESAHNAGLRPIVATIDREMSRLAGGTPIETRAGIGELLESWTELVELLALGPEPEHGGMRDGG